MTKYLSICTCFILPQIICLYNSAGCCSDVFLVEFFQIKSQLVVLPGTVLASPALKWVATACNTHITYVSRSHQAACVCSHFKVHLGQLVRLFPH